MNRNAFTPLEISYVDKHKSKFLTGFTLAELIFVSALTVIIMGALVALYSTNHQFYTIASIFTELRGETKNFKNQVTKDIEEAVSVVSSHMFVSTTYTTSSSELVLKCYATTSSGFDTGHYDYIAYRRDGTDLKRVVDADNTNSVRGDSDRVFIENAESMTFSYYDNDENPSSGSITTTTRIVIDLGVEKTWTGKNREESIHASVRLRNKRD